jgi:hypothetical protein
MDDYFRPIYGDNPTFEDVTYDSNGFNEWFGYGVVQPGKTIKENIFPEIRNSIDKKEGKYHFTVTNWPAAYAITGPGVSKDDKGYFADLTGLPPGKYSYIFTGKCDYQGKMYDFPINRTLTLVDPTVEATHITKMSARVYPNPTTGRIALESPGGIVAVAVFDITGRKQLEQLFPGAPSAEIDLSDLSPGIYIVHVTGKNKMVFQTRVLKK